MNALAGLDLSVREVIPALFMVGVDKIYVPSPQIDVYEWSLITKATFTSDGVYVRVENGFDKFYPMDRRQKILRPICSFCDCVASSAVGNTRNVCATCLVLWQAYREQLLGLIDLDNL